jgi:hypothetical protein
MTSKIEKLRTVDGYFVIKEIYIKFEVTLVKKD